MGPEFYEKDKGSAQIHGHIFEYKFCALSFLRARNKGYRFKLASNMKGLGAFDDVVVEYLDDNSSKKHIFLQLKSKTKRHITMQELKSIKGDFSLRKYYDSYIQAEKNFNCSEGVKMDGSIDESLFIIYTNTDVAGKLLSNKVTDIGEEGFLMTGDSVLQFNEEEHKAIYEHLQGLPKYREFLSRFRIIYRQADEKGMDGHIERELQNIMKLPESELDLTYMCFIEFVKDWWKNSNYFLKDTNSKENDLLGKTKEKVRTILLAKILDKRKSELDDLSIKYKESAIIDMEQMIEPHKAVLIFAPGRSTTLTAAKIHQVLNVRKHIILNLQQLVRYKTEVMLAWKKKFDVLVLESQSSTENFQEVLDEISMILNECGVEKRFIFIANRMGNIEQISAIRSTFSTKLIEEYDDWKFTDIITESKTLFLEKKIIFQGFELQIKDIVKESDIRMLNALDGDSMSLLLGDEKPSIGIPIEETLDYYIDRALEFIQNVKPGNQKVSELLSPFRNDSMEELKGISACTENNCKISDHGRGNPQLSPANENEQEPIRVCNETNKMQCSETKEQKHPREPMRDDFGNAHRDLERKGTGFWRPSTLLEGENRTILVIDEPGMGKSTLLTHLAKETQQRHPNIWIVRVNINNYTRILHEIKTKGFDENSAFKLLIEAAQIKESDSVQLEKQLFNYIYKSTGNMAVLIDGVDEVGPHYAEEIIRFLRILSKTKIRKIWITSRNFMKDQLEQETQCQSYSLLPFSVEDQKSFLLKFWNQKGDYVKDLANRVVELSCKYLSDRDKNFMGVPLQGMLLAEMFEESLKHLSTSRLVKLPEYINIVMLYDSYLNKKWEIYVGEKKNSDPTKVSVKNDDEFLRGPFLDNHKAAALLAILSTQHFEKINDKNIQKQAADFVQRMKQGNEKTGIITDVIDSRPVFQHRTLAEYLAAMWLCENIQTSQTFVMDHLFESGFGEVRSMVDRILADTYPLHEAVLNSNIRHVKSLLKRELRIHEKDHGGRTPLHVAVSCRSPELITLLLEHGADVSSVDTLLGLTPVEYAIRITDWQVLSFLMENRPEIREQVLNDMNLVCTEYNSPALRAAARYGHTDLLRYLISRGNCENVALTGDDGTLLHEAARGNHIQTVTTLVDLGANCDIQNANGKTALHVSAETGSLQVTQFIVERQEMSYVEDEFEYILALDKTITKLNRLNVRDKDGNTPLHLAAAAGNTSTVRYLLSAGSDFRSCNTRGEYPLSLAARYGRNDTVKLLLQSCSAVKCEEIMTNALKAAIEAVHVETTAFLITSGAPVRGEENEEPIHIASRMGQQHMVKLLLKNGASLMSRNDRGNTALHLAVVSGNKDLVKDLVDWDKNGVNCLNDEKETPLHLAARNGSVYLVNYLNQNGCNINASSANGATCLHIACENGHYATVEYLLEHRAKVNAMNSADQTPLHIAACRGQTKVVELLFLHNANFSVRDQDGITALLAASINGHQDTVLFIVQHGGNIEDTDRNGNTIAHFAVTNESHGVLNFLSENHENLLNVQNSDGETPLLQAVREGRNWIAQYVREETSGNRTALDDAVIKLIRLLMEGNVPSGKAGRYIVEAARFGFLYLLQRFVDFGDDINVKADNGESPLHAACKSGQVATVEYLSEKGALLDLQDNNGNTALHVAVSNGHLDITRVLVKRSANLTTVDASGSTALHIAAKGGYLNIVQYLADNFAPIDMRNANNETALLVAAAEGHGKIVTILIEKGAGVGVRDIEGKTALDIATEKGHTAITKLLRDRAEGRKLECPISHADSEGDNFHSLPRKLNTRAPAVKETDRKSNKGAQILKIRADKFHPKTRSALHVAAANNNLEEVQRLVKSGIALDYLDKFGRTALWVAASRGLKSIVQVLLENGSCVNVPDCEGIRPIDIAAREGHCEAVDVIRMYDPTISPENAEYLKVQLYEASESGDIQTVQAILKCGISLKTTNNGDNTPLHISANRGHKEISCTLLDFGANVNVKDKHGRTPLILSAENGHIDVVRELLNRGASVHIADKHNFTPLHVAARKGHKEVVRDLLKHGASVNIKDIYDFTPLYEVVRKGHVEVIRELLNHGAGVDIANNDCETPLCIAAQYGHLEVIRVLLKHGARVDHSNNDGETPLYMAARDGHVEVSRLLLSHGATVDVTSKRGATPLHISALHGHAEEAGLLLNFGASVDIANEDGWTPLHEAASKGHVQVVRKLLNRGACVDIASNIGWKPLNTAAFRGHVEVVRELLNHGANVDTTSTDGCTPLNAAAQEGHLQVVRELLNHGANVYITRKNGWTPLNEAALNGHVEVVRELLNHGVGIDFLISRGKTTLYLAAANGHLEAVRELLNHGASVNIVKNNAWVCLKAAAEMGHVEIVREVLKHGVAVDVASEDGWTPLNRASRLGHTEVVLELLNHGANMDKTNNDGCTPLNTAAQEGHVEIVRGLLDRGASVDIANESGWTPLNTAARCGHLEVVRELLNHEASVDIANNEGATPLITAASEGHVEFVRIFLDHGATLDIRDKVGFTPLNAAAKSGHVEVVRELLDHGASANTTNNEGCTPLNAAAKEGHAEVVRELLNHGANMDTRSNDGCTRLAAAAQKGHVKIVRGLLDHGASVDIADESGWTPLNTAARCGHLEVVRELLNHGASVDIANNEGATPLITAASEGHVEFIRIFLDYGATLDIRDKSGFYPLNAAALNGHVEIIRVLLSHGAGVNNADDEGCTPLYTASRKGHVKFVRELLNHGAKLDIANKEGFTPLYSAVSSGHVGVVRELLNHGAHMDISKESGWSLCNAAAQRGNLEVIRVLLKHALGENIPKLCVWKHVEKAAEEGDMESIRYWLKYIGSKWFAKKLS